MDMNDIEMDLLKAQGNAKRNKSCSLSESKKRGKACWTDAVGDDEGVWTPGKRSAPPLTPSYYKVRYAREDPMQQGTSKRSTGQHRVHSILRKFSHPTSGVGTGCSSPRPGVQRFCTKASLASDHERRVRGLNCTPSKPKEPLAEPEIPSSNQFMASVIAAVSTPPRARHTQSPPQVQEGDALSHILDQGISLLGIFDQRGEAPTPHPAADAKQGGARGGLMQGFGGKWFGEETDANSSGVGVPKKGSSFEGLEATLRTGGAQVGGLGVARRATYVASPQSTPTRKEMRDAEEGGGSRLPFAGISANTSGVVGSGGVKKKGKRKLALGDHSTASLPLSSSSSNTDIKQDQGQAISPSASESHHNKGPRDPLCPAAGTAFVM